MFMIFLMPTLYFNFSINIILPKERAAPLIKIL
jgi:hypothetical protein